MLGYLENNEQKCLKTPDGARVMAQRTKAAKGRYAGTFQAIAYLRTSSAANVGADKDSAKREE